jgi:hypothetical protein
LGWLISSPTPSIQSIMSTSHLQLVNQKLAFANAIITILAALPAHLTTAEKLQQQALKDSAVFHLVTALHFYLRELAESHRIANLRAINSIQDLVAALSKIDKVSSEVLELAEIEQVANSWLSQLTRYHAQLLFSPVKAKERKAFGRENVIEAIELTAADEEASFALTTEILEFWLANFRSLIARQRETSAEY